MVLQVGRNDMWSVDVVLSGTAPITPPPLSAGESLEIMDSPTPLSSGVSVSRLRVVPPREKQQNW